MVTYKITEIEEVIEPSIVKKKYISIFLNDKEQANGILVEDNETPEEACKKYMANFCNTYKVPLKEINEVKIYGNISK